MITYNKHISKSMTNFSLMIIARYNSKVVVVVVQ